MPRRHLMPETYTPCPLCGERISTAARSCFHCGADDGPSDRPPAAVMVIADYRTDKMHTKRFYLQPHRPAGSFKTRRWLRGQSFQVIFLVLSVAILLPLIGPLVLKLVRS